MKKILLIILPLIILPLIILSLTTGCGGEKNTAIDDNAQDLKTVVIGFDDEFAPMSFRNEHGGLVGFDIDLAKEAARRMGITIKFQPIDWNKKREEITSGNIDVIWNGLDITDERKEYMIFSKPYMDDRQIFLIKKDNNQNIHTEGDLEGKRVGIQAGSIAETYFDENDKLKGTFKDFKTYGKFNDVLDDLKNGEIDVFVCDELVARYEMNIHPDQFRIVDAKTGYVTEMGIGFRKEDTALRDKFQQAFDEMVDDGTAKKISEHWFNADLIKAR